MHRGNTQGKYAWANKYAWGIYTQEDTCLRGQICTEGQRLMEGIYEDKYVHGDKYFCRAYPKTIHTGGHIRTGVTYTHRGGIYAWGGHIHME
jgi:hypothetical protein